MPGVRNYKTVFNKHKSDKILFYYILKEEMNIYKDKVIVLKQNLFEESHLIIHTLNTQGSRLSFIARGAKKSRKRFAGGVLEPGHFIGVEYRQARHSTLHFLQSAWFLRRFNGLRKDYDRLSLALHFLNLVEKISQEGMEDCADVFNLLGNSLNALEYSRDLSALQFVFEYRLLLSQGVLPTQLHLNKTLLGLTVENHLRLNKESIHYQDMKPAVHSAIEDYVFGK